MDFDDEELMEEKSFKTGGGEEEDPLFEEDVIEDDLGIGPDADFGLEDGEQMETSDGY